MEFRILTGTTYAAPRVIGEVSTVPEWSGKQVWALGDEDVRDICEFCEDIGMVDGRARCASRYRYGRHRAVQSVQSVRADIPVAGVPLHVVAHDLSPWGGACETLVLALSA